MNIEELVNRAYTSWAHDKGTSWTDHMRAALTEQAEAYEQQLAVRQQIADNLRAMLKATEDQLAESRERIRQMEAERTPEQWKLLPSRCPLCEYQHGHRIGCDNNSVDIALRDAASALKEGE